VGGVGCVGQGTSEAGRGSGRGPGAIAPQVPPFTDADVDEALTRFTQPEVERAYRKVAPWLVRVSFPRDSVVTRKTVSVRDFAVVTAAMTRSTSRDLRSMVTQAGGVRAGAGWDAHPRLRALRYLRSPATVPNVHPLLVNQRLSQVTVSTADFQIPHRASPVRGLMLRAQLSCDVRIVVRGHKMLRPYMKFMTVGLLESGRRWRVQTWSATARAGKAVRTRW
jgi:hypothetical protein